jgi:glycosyltransferase involved in cell wall biosynthesis
MGTDSTIAHVIVNNLGGITSLVQNLIIYKGDDAIEQEFIVLDIKDNQSAPAIFDKKIESITRYFRFDPKDNWYSIYGKLAGNLSEHNGVLVTNDQYDLIMLQAFNIPRKVVQLVHDPYNVSLSIKFHSCIDRFITHSKFINEQLLMELPDRKDDIVHIPYGIPLPNYAERSLNADQPLKLIFLGRHDKAKGVYDLFEIDRLLKEKNIPVSWTILGKGPETGSLKEQWKNELKIKFLTPVNHKEIIDELSLCDLFVFPTKFEGFPVALLEAMSAGCVPVVTDLPGGITELVEDGVTGYKCPLDQNHFFAEKIILLHENRSLMQRLQNNGMRKVFGEYNVEVQAPRYQKEFLNMLKQQSIPRHHNVNRKIGSRLDQKWLPNSITKVLRRII